MSTVLFAVLFAASSSTSYLENEGGSSSGGAISGKITYAGKPPPPAKLNVTVDRRYCGATREEDVWLIGPDHGVKNVVVYLSDIKSGKKMTAAQRLTLNQTGCRYVPRISVVGQGAGLEIKSDDPVLHNVHSYQEGMTLFNVAVPPAQGFVISKKLDNGGGVKFKCDVHNFMRGAIFVALNPYFAITAEDGSYEISDVPAGTYTINTWHEAAGPVSGQVTVTQGGAAAWNQRIR
jgi:plastocyanin